MALTRKELMLLEDSIEMSKNNTMFLQSCINSVSDPQLKNLCQQVIGIEQSKEQSFSQYLNY